MKHTVQSANTLKTIDYGDSLGRVLLWQKSLILVPLWGLLVLPWVAWSCRNGSASVLTTNFAFLMAFFTVYYVNDLLKRKITLDNDFIYFGLRAISIKDLTEIRIIRNHLALFSQTGFKLKLNLNGLDEADVDALIKHLQINNSRMDTKDVQARLKQIRGVQTKPAEALDRLELPLNTKLPFIETIETCKRSARKWVRLGPALLALLFSQAWIPGLWFLYNLGCPDGVLRYEHVGFMSLANLLGAPNSYSLGLWPYQLLLFLTPILINPLALLIESVICAVLLLFAKRLLLKANVVILDQEGLRLCYRALRTTVPMNTITWAEIGKLSLIKDREHFGRIEFRKTDGQRFALDAQLLTPDHRSLMLNRIQKFAPNCQIDQDLAEHLLPKSNQSYTEIWLQSLSKSPERAALDPLAAGQILWQGRFEVIRKIGVGGQGTAYLCRDLHDDSASNVVLKETIVPVFANNATTLRELKRFEKEANILQDLKHPGVVSLTQYFVEDHRAYLVLEHVDGLSLLELVKRDGALPEERVRELASQMLEILGFLHSRGVVHRDFTPDNLLLNSKGKLKLIDFNVAQRGEQGATGTIVGKHAYLPPEQFRGKANIRSDIYAFGATLFYLLTAKDPEPISQSIPGSVNAEISQALSDVVKKATALKEEERYGNIDELKLALFSEVTHG